MTQEDKELLFQDLCGRLPYKVKCEVYNRIGVLDETTTFYGVGVTYADGQDTTCRIDECKPYLFPLSSMTEEQKREYYSLAEDVTIKPGPHCYLGIKIHCIKLGISDNPHEGVWDDINLGALDWLNRNHFDYRSLIEKGLAINCTDLNIY